MTTEKPWWDTEKEIITVDDLHHIVKPYNDRHRYREALEQVRNELRNEIDGSIETRGRDSRISAIIQICDAALD